MLPHVRFLQVAEGKVTLCCRFLPFQAVAMSSHQDSFVATGNLDNISKRCRPHSGVKASHGQRPGKRLTGWQMYWSVAHRHRRETDRATIETLLGPTPGPHRSKHA